MRLDGGSTGSLDSRLILQVHDEVLLEVRPEDVEPAGRLVVDVMAGASALRVPLEVNLSVRVQLGRSEGVAGMAKAMKDRRRAGPVFYVAVVLLVFILYSVAMAWATVEDCGHKADEE